MIFYYVDTNNELTQISGSNQKIKEAIISRCKQEKTSTGFIGAIDFKGKLRATLILNKYGRGYYTKLDDFIRKYSAIYALEELSERLRQAYHDN